jgi:hypothetical protein
MFAWPTIAAHWELGIGSLRIAVTVLDCTRK